MKFFGFLNLRGISGQIAALVVVSVVALHLIITASFLIQRPDQPDPSFDRGHAQLAAAAQLLSATPVPERPRLMGDIARAFPMLGIESLARNVGEVIGVFGDLEIPDKPSILGYASSIKMRNLDKLEDDLKTLWSPLWPADFPAIDQEAAAKGWAIYTRDNSCVRCHTIVKDRTSKSRVVVSSMRADGTDPLTSFNFTTRKGDSGKLQGMNVTFVPFTQTIPPIADPGTMITNEVIGSIVGSVWPAPPDDLAKVKIGMQPTLALEATDVGPKYKARPLNGVWATAPYLHNGSVPNLTELLKPAAQRLKKFSIGAKTYDPVNVGFVTDAAGLPKFDTGGTGSSNMGHEGDEYGTNLSDAEKKQLIEYLKTL